MSTEVKLVLTPERYIYENRLKSTSLKKDKKTIDKKTGRLSDAGVTGTTQPTQLMQRTLKELTDVPVIGDTGKYIINKKKSQEKETVFGKNRPPLKETPGGEGDTIRSTVNITVKDATIIDIPSDLTFDEDTAATGSAAAAAAAAAAGSMTTPRPQTPADVANIRQFLRKTTKNLLLPEGEENRQRINWQTVEREAMTQAFEDRFERLVLTSNGSYTNLLNATGRNISSFRRILQKKRQQKKRPDTPMV